MSVEDRIAADPHIQGIFRKAGEILSMGGRVWFKWTCVGCGERVTCDQENELHTSYIHEDCGAETDTLDGDIGIMALLPGKGG